MFFMYGIIMKQFYEGQSNLTPTQLRIRCPYCFQIFRALKEEFEEDQPDFQCSVCRETFWVDSKDTDSIIVGKPADTQKKGAAVLSGLGISTKICPRCTEEVSIGDQECSYCGVVFIKLIEGGSTSFPLRGAWAKVVKNWHDENMHDTFLAACHKQDELVYGISCYGRILKEDKNNKKAQEMIKRMEALTWFFEEEISLPKLPFREMFYRKAQNIVKSYAFDALMLALAICLLTYVFV